MIRHFADDEVEAQKLAEFCTPEGAVRGISGSDQLLCLLTYAL